MPQTRSSAARTEASVLTSLSELRAIERQRLDDERDARERALAEAREAERAAEQARRDAEEARARAEREERVRVEEARAAAEREARLRIAAGEAAERSRAALELEARRLTEETALRRAEIARRRPRWMVAVTGIALAAATALAVFAIDRSRQADEADRAIDTARRERDEAKLVARTSREQIEAAQRKVTELGTKIEDGNRALTGTLDRLDAEDEARRRTVLAREHEALERHLAEVKAAQDKRDRDATVDLRACSKTGALGCLDHK
jgi:dTMP kinase